MQHYPEIVLTHFEKPRHIGTLDITSPAVGTGQAGTRQNGDAIQLQLQISAQKIIEAAKFKAYGSVWTIAAASWLTDEIQGLSLDILKTFSGQQMAVTLSLPSVKHYVIYLIEDALKAAINNYEEKQHVHSIHAHSINAGCNSPCDPVDS